MARLSKAKEAQNAEEKVVVELSQEEDLVHEAEDSVEETEEDILEDDMAQEEPEELEEIEEPEVVLEPEVNIDMKALDSVLAPKVTEPKNERIRLRYDHKCNIGGEMYDFKKGQCYNVPVGVKKRLNKAGLLSPL